MELRPVALGDELAQLGDERGEVHPGDVTSNAGPRVILHLDDEQRRTSSFRLTIFPRFDAIAADQIVPAVRTLIERQDAARAALEGSLAPTWEGLAAPLSALGEPLGYAWNVTHHLLSVRNSPALREAQEAVQGDVVAASLRLGQSRALYDRLPEAA